MTQPIPLMNSEAQYAPLVDELKERFAAVLASGKFIFGPEVEAFEHESAAFLGVPARHRCRERHGRARPLARGAGHRPRRRGDLSRVHVLRDRRGDRTRRRDARVRGHRPRHPEPRSRGRRGAHHAADEGDHARAPLRAHRTARRARGRSGFPSSRTRRRRSAPRASLRRASARRSASSRRRTSSRSETAGS